MPFESSSPFERQPPVEEGEEKSEENVEESAETPAEPTPEQAPEQPEKPQVEITEEEKKREERYEQIYELYNEQEEKQKELERVQQPGDEQQEAAIRAMKEPVKQMVLDSEYADSEGVKNYVADLQLEEFRLRGTIEDLKKKTDIDAETREANIKSNEAQLRDINNILETYKNNDTKPLKEYLTGRLDGKLDKDWRGEEGLEELAEAISLKEALNSLEQPKEEKKIEAEEKLKTEGVKETEMPAEKEKETREKKLTPEETLISLLKLEEREIPKFKESLSKIEKEKRQEKMAALIKGILEEKGMIAPEEESLKLYEQHFGLTEYSAPELWLRAPGGTAFWNEKEKCPKIHLNPQLNEFKPDYQLLTLVEGMNRYQQLEQKKEIPVPKLEDKDSIESLKKILEMKDFLGFDEERVDSLKKVLKGLEDRAEKEKEIPKPPEKPTVEVHAPEAPKREKKEVEKIKKEAEPTVEELYGFLTPPDRGRFSWLKEKLTGDPLDRAEFYLKNREKIIERADKKIAKFEKKQQQAESNIQDTKAALSREESAFRIAEEKIRKFGGERAGEIIEKSRDRLDKKKEELEKKVEENETRKIKIGEKIGEIKNKREEYESKRKELVEKVDEVVMEKIAGKGNEIDKHREHSEVLKGQIEKNKIEISRLKDNIQEVKEAMSSVKGTSSEKDVKKLLKELKNEKGGLEKVNRKTVKLETKVENRINKLERENGKLAAKLSEEKIGELLANKENWNWLINKIPAKKLENLIASGVLPNKEELRKQGFLLGKPSREPTPGERVPAAASVSAGERTGRKGLGGATPEQSLGKPEAEEVDQEKVSELYKKYIKEKGKGKVTDAIKGKLKEWNLDLESEKGQKKVIEVIIELVKEKKL